MALQTLHRDSPVGDPLVTSHSEIDADDQLSEAARFVTHLQLQLAELDRREQQLNTQIALAEEQQQAVRRDTLRLADATTAANQAFAARQKQLQQAELELQKREETLAQQLAEVAQLTEQLQLDRVSFSQMQETQRQQAAEQIEQERLAFQEECLVRQMELTEQRSEWERERAEHQRELKRQQQAWLQEQQEERRKLAESEAALQATAAEARAQFLEQIEQDRLLAERKISEERQQIQEERREILAEVEAERERIREERLLIQSQREEQDRLNQQWAEHRRAERRDHLQELEEIGRERLAALDQREAEIHRREVDMQKRIRLHEDHLDKARKELATQRDAITWQQQRHRQWAEQVEQSVQLRLSQIRHFRDLLTERERSLAEEQALLAKQRDEQTSWTAMQRESLLSERRQFHEMQHRERQLYDIRQERLDLETVQFHEMCQRLHPLLERLQTFVAGCPADPASGDAESLNTAANLLVEQLGILEETQRQLSAQQQIRREEEVRLTAWIERRESWMSERETSFNQQLSELIARESAWQAERERWHQERLEVEQAVRALVMSLEGEISISQPETVSSNAA